MITLTGREPKKIFLTTTGAAELGGRLEELLSTRRLVTEELSALAAENSVSSAMYDSAQTASHTQINEIDTQINLIKRIMVTATIVTTPLRVSKVVMGTKVVVDIKGQHRTYTIVGSIETDPLEGKISNESPLGKSLLGKKVGETFDIELPGQRSLSATIVSIS
jgi:transcription elongation factor GreA